MDGGNTNYQDTIRRIKSISNKVQSTLLVWASLVVKLSVNWSVINAGGQEEAYNKVADILMQLLLRQKTVLHVLLYIGPNGAGHYVKMVHNGIEYADMQLIAESYAMMKELLGMSHEDIVKNVQRLECW